MNKRGFLLGTTFLGLMGLCPIAVYAQDDGSQAPAPYVQLYAQAQLDQMLAPVALYPDPLIGQILMASTYPLEVVEASRWIRTRNNSYLSGAQLADSVEQQPWDPSVKSLTAFPAVLQMMATNIQWTEQLGDAFLAQQPAVMDSVQHLRQQAISTGNLTSTPQQIVSSQGNVITIEPENPDTIYVPAYNSSVVYGSWGYPGYPPYNFYPNGLGYGYGNDVIGFSAGIIVADAIWGWNSWDWRHHRIDIDDRRYRELNRGAPPPSPGRWEHNPDHRLGVPYRDNVTRAHFHGNEPPEGLRAVRGYNPTTVIGANRGTSQYTPPSAQLRRPQAVPVAPQVVVQHQQQEPAATARTSYTPPQRSAPTPVLRREPAPIYESFSHGNDVRSQSERGMTSRAITQSPQPTQHMAAPMQMPSHASPQQAPSNVNRGGGGGGAPHESNDHR